MYKDFVHIQHYDFSAKKFLNFVLRFFFVLIFFKNNFNAVVNIYPTFEMKILINATNNEKLLPLINLALIFNFIYFFYSCF